MDLIKNDYIKESGTGNTWKVEISPPLQEVKTYFEETVSAIEYINSNKTGKFQLLYSGGVDSQYVCEVLLRLKINFDPVIIELKNNQGEILNYHEVKYAHEFCLNRNLKPTVYDLNFEKFVDSGKIIEIAESVNCSFIEIPATIYAASQLDGFSLMGSGDVWLKYNPEKNIWLFEDFEYNYALSRYYKKNNLNGTPFFLGYTPEMFLSFLIDPSIKKLGTGQVPGKLGSHSTKSHVYNNGSNFNLPVYDYVKKDRIKYTGYEKIYKSSLMEHPNIKMFDEFKKTWNGEYFESYTDLVSRLSIHQTTL